MAIPLLPPPPVPPWIRRRSKSFCCDGQARKRRSCTGEHRFPDNFSPFVPVRTTRGRASPWQGATRRRDTLVLVACAHACAATCYETAKRHCPRGLTLLMRGSPVSFWFLALSSTSLSLSLEFASILPRTFHYDNVLLCYSCRCRRVGDATSGRFAEPRSRDVRFERKFEKFADPPRFPRVSIWFSLVS